MEFGVVKSKMLLRRYLNQNNSDSFKLFAKMKLAPPSIFITLMLNTSFSSFIVHRQLKFHVVTII